jgi:hypothetical protein
MQSGTASIVRGSRRDVTKEKLTVPCVDASPDSTTKFGNTH